MRKKIIITSAVVLWAGLTAYAQNFSYNKKDKNENSPPANVPRELSFDLKARYTRPITKDKLDNANILSDFITGYATSWITNYDSAEIFATCNGKFMRAISANDALTAEQKNILKTVDEGTVITINVIYKAENSVTGDILNNVMKVTMMIVPEKEAAYVGGEKQMKKYLKENAIDKISETTGNQFQNAYATVIFTVGEQGEIINAKISKTFGDAKTDKLLVEVISKMPKWKPAENSRGLKVKQDFEFSIGNGGC